jgi:hypothetical protein
VPRDVVGQSGPSYQLVVLENGRALAERLEELGARVIAFRGALELWVNLPESVGTELLVRTALDTHAPLSRLSPLFGTTASTS